MALQNTKQNKKLNFFVFANFRGINTPTIADFKLPIILQHTYKIPGCLAIGATGYMWPLHSTRLKVELLTQGRVFRTLSSDWLTK